MCKILELLRIFVCLGGLGKSSIHTLFNGLEVLFSASDKAKLFAKNSSKKSNLEDSLSHFPSRTNLKLHNISVIPKMVIKVITLIFHRHPVLIAVQC